MKILGIAFTGTPVTNISRSREFYEGVLGLTPTLETLGGMLVEYSFNNGTFTIGCLGAAFKPSSDGSFIALEVANLESCIAELHTQGVKFLIEITELPSSRFAVILDPDENKIMIHERKP